VDLNFEFRVEGLEKLKSQPTRFERAYAQVGRQVMIKASAALARSVALRFNKPAGGLSPAIDTGLLRNSVAWRVPTMEGRTIQGGVGTNVAYALPVELGSRPHWPPLAPIELWVRRKLRIPDRRAKAVAFLVARKIARRGTAPRKIFALGLEDAKPAMAEIFSQLPRLILANMEQPE